MLERVQRPAPPPIHLTLPTGANWHWWRDAVLRSAGFPSAMARTLAVPELGAGADRLVAARDELDAACSEVQAWLSAEIAQERAPGASAGPVRLRELGRASKAVRRREAPAWLADLMPAALYDRLAGLARQHARHLADYQRQYDDAVRAVGAALAKIAGDPLLRQAVTWQNHAAIEMALDPLARQDDMPGSRRKQREALVANYVQRYSLKNDTIGFFGPMAWIRIDKPGADTRYQTGAGLLRRRTVRFEDWPVACLAQRIASHEQSLPALVPRRQPFIRLRQRSLILPGGATVELPELHALVLAACDGSRDVSAVVRAMLANPYSPFTGAGQIHGVLRELARTDRISLGFKVPSCSPEPELALRPQLRAIPDPGLREMATAQLDSLVAARDAIVAAAGNADQLRTRMAQLDALFSELTGMAPRRRGGEAYGGRALAYEDCHRDLTLVFDEAMLAPLRRPLDLLLSSARWLTCEAAKRFHAAFEDIYHAACARVPASTEGVSLCDFWLSAQTVVFGEFPPIVELAAQLRERWGEMLAPYLQSNACRVSLDAGQLADGVAAAFPARGSGWTLARYQCPDLMFCARDPQALLDGDYLAVMGELHVGCNTLATNMFLSQHPDPAALQAGIRADLGQGYVVGKLSPDASGTPIRTQLADDPDGSIDVLFSSGMVPANSSAAIPISELTVCMDNGRLVARRAGTAWQCGLLDLLGDFLSLAVINRFGLLKKSWHTPRITIDRLVVQRESWQFAREALAPLLDGDEAAAFLAARSWARAQELPDRVFVKVAWEDKPFYLDFTSPVFVRLFVKQLRGAQENGRDADALVALSEMLPDFDALWLRDADGNSFTSELRVVCVHGDDIAERSPSAGSRAA